MAASNDTQFIICNAGDEDVEVVFKVMNPGCQEQTPQPPPVEAAPIEQLQQQSFLEHATTYAADPGEALDAVSSDSDDSFVSVPRPLPEASTATAAAPPPMPMPDNSTASSHIAQDRIPVTSLPAGGMVVKAE
jgi:hypothetical protein